MSSPNIFEPLVIIVEAVINEDTYIRCLECSKWMTIGRKKVSREKAKNYCSKACRSQAYERRKKIKSCEELHELVNNFDIKKHKGFDNISNYQELLDKLSINIKNKNLLDSMLKTIFKCRQCYTLSENALDHAGLDVEKSKGFMGLLDNILNDKIKYNWSSYWDWDMNR